MVFWKNDKLCFANWTWKFSCSLEKHDKEVVVPDIFSDGVLLSEAPIDLYEYYTHFKKSDNDIVAHELLKKVSNLVEAMLNHDGICLFTNDGILVGYH